MYPRYDADTDTILLSETCRIVRIQTKNGHIRVITGIGDYQTAVNDSRLHPDDYRCHFVQKTKTTSRAFQIVFNTSFKTREEV